MAERTCTIEDCGRKLLARGWCSTHYARWYKHGDPLFELVPPTLMERFWAKFEVVEGGCWRWTATVRQGGYGLFTPERSTSPHGWTTMGAHRWAYSVLVEPIPDGMHVDHLCCNPRCVNPAHLELVTPAENTRRGAEYRRRGRVSLLHLRRQERAA